jgi:hypothetical protein
MDGGGGEGRGQEYDIMDAENMVLSYFHILEVRQERGLPRDKLCPFSDRGQKMENIEIKKGTIMNDGGIEIRGRWGKVEMKKQIKTTIYRESAN